MMAAALSVTTFVSTAESANAVPNPQPAAARTAHHAPISHVSRACADPRPGRASCFAEYRTDIHGGRGLRGPASHAPAGTRAATMPDGYGPADLHSAYKLPWTGGSNQTVAIVGAYDDPNAEADLAIYRQTYGLPACTTANGCFREVNQRGDSSPLPTPNTGWSKETSLDLDMVSAACPDCHILLVEADNNDTYESLGSAVDTAVRLGATVVSNSYGAIEDDSVPDFAAHYNHPGVPILASSGDNGFLGQAQAPASFSTVISVGGTALTKAVNARGWTESAWGSPLSGGAGSGCSALIDKPAWQKDTHCDMRTVSDVSAVADINPGLAVYDSYGIDASVGWQVMGGTSAATPIIAGVFGLAGNGKQINDASYLYAHADKLLDITSGSNGYPTVGGAFDCGGDYLCNALPGYDAPTGLGVPNGLGAF
ncbi:S53 family peptidase [Streptomyces sp. NPDC004362]|uniref:S53 family peptidase n=1 Tax=Streptomyces sp. NPDC004362 TaxID=3154456 RepID=UPI0033B86C3E